MPILDRQCSNCSHVFESIELRTKEDGEVECPECHHSGCKKIFSASGQSFRLYGDGFYKRDHKDTGDWG